MLKSLTMCAKHIIDLVGSLAGLIILSPLFIIIMISIKATSEGPVFFRQERLGKDGRVFNIIKFRTMIVNAEQMGDGLVVKSAADDRITKAGRFLRATSMDELPQLFNVLKMDMSLVGPRPPVVYFPYDGYENYPAWAQKRFLVRPGITGLAQVTVRNSVDWDERIEIDNQYVDELSLWLDFKILLRTISKLTKPDNVYDEEPNKEEGEI